jgi:hypothetical protein
MLTKVISGGQTGADQAGWRAARAAGIPTGGAMPLGFLTEAGPCPEFAELYGAREMPTASYKARTEQNVRDADAVLWFGDQATPGGKATLRFSQTLGKSIVFVMSGVSRPSMIVEWLRNRGDSVVLMVAGNRESKAPVIGDRVERFLAAVLRRLADGS